MNAFTTEAPGTQPAMRAATGSPVAPGTFVQSISTFPARSSRASSAVAGTASRLSALGSTFLRPIEAFGQWAAEHGDAVVEARSGYERSGNGLAWASSSSGTAAAASVTSVDTRPDRSTASTASAFGRL